jgi:hypothetical protein
MTAVLPAPDPPRPNAPTAIAGGRTRVAEAIVPRIAVVILSDSPLCHVTFTTIRACRGCDDRYASRWFVLHNRLTRTTTGRCQSLPQSDRCVQIPGDTRCHHGATACIGRCSPFRRREFPHRRRRQQTSVTPKARYDIAAWLGGTKTSAAELTVQFLDTGNRILPTRRRPATTMPPRAIAALLSASRPPRRT